MCALDLFENSGAFSRLDYPDKQYWYSKTACPHRCWAG